MVDNLRQIDVRLRNNQDLQRRFAIERVLGVGGMGVVVLATQKDLARPVAIKFLHSEVLEDPETVARFMREGRAAAKLRSEHVCRVLDVGELPELGPYLVMEYLHGQDLESLLRDRGPLAVGEAVSLVLQACEALAEAHASGIVHRDLKPSNLFLTRDAFGSACVKVLDFGISKMEASKVPGGAAMNLTRSNAAVGSPLYMPPEQLRAARHVDERADIWSIGCTLYELLAGHPVWREEKIHQVLTSVLTKLPAGLREERPDVPESLESTILRCLSKTPEGRFATVSELAAELAPHADGSGAQSIERLLRGVALQAVPSRAFDASAHTLDVKTPGSQAPATEGSVVDGQSVPSASVSRQPRRRAGVLGAAAAGVAGVVALFGFFSSWPGEHDKPQQATVATAAIAAAMPPESSAPVSDPPAARLLSVAALETPSASASASASEVDVPSPPQSRRRPPSPSPRPPSPRSTTTDARPPATTRPATAPPIYSGGRY